MCPAISFPYIFFAYLRKALKDTAMRTSEYKIINKLLYTKKLVKICSLVETDRCERCNEQIEDFKHPLWECRYSVNIWKEVKRQKWERFGVNLEIKYHTMLLGVSQNTTKYGINQVVAMSHLQVAKSYILVSQLNRLCQVNVNILYLRRERERERTKC